jgi:sugar phosphate isomerase/epimerase
MPVLAMTNGSFSIARPGIVQGSVNWPEVRKALDDVGYNGWLTDETGLGWRELSHRLDRIIAGEPPLPSGK